MAVKRLEIVNRAPYEEGREFGDVGAYERIDAIAHYAVDPNHDANVARKKAWAAAVERKPYIPKQQRG